MSCGGGFTPLDKQMFTSSELVTIRRWQMFTDQELAAIRRWQKQRFTPADLAVISCWEASRPGSPPWDATAMPDESAATVTTEWPILDSRSHASSDEEEEAALQEDLRVIARGRSGAEGAPGLPLDEPPSYASSQPSSYAEHPQFLRKKEALVREWSAYAASHPVPFWAPPSTPSWAPYPCYRRVRDVPGDAACSHGCFMCATVMVLRDLCPHILWYLPEHRCAQRDWSEAELTEIIRQTDFRQWEDPESGAHSPAPHVWLGHVPRWRQYTVGGRPLTDEGYVCRRIRCYKCAGAVLLRHNYPLLFGDLPMLGCDIYETWFYDHRHRILAARHEPTVPGQPASKKRRQPTW